MAGHSKWANIKHKKAAADAKKGKIFSKLAKEMMVSSRMGGGDPGSNITLRTLVQKARSYNMPADNIERAIKKGTGDLEGQSFEEIIYEGYAPGGVAMIVSVLTDNKNRSAAEVRHCFTKHNASLASAGAVAHMFNRKGQIYIDSESVEEEKLMDTVLEAGAEDMKNEGEVFEVLTGPSEYPAVVEALEAAKIQTADSELTLLPDIHQVITDLSEAKVLMNFIEALEDLDDVQDVYTNMDIPDDIMSALQED